jgi:hypothetical protein
MLTVDLVLQLMISFVFLLLRQRKQRFTFRLQLHQRKSEPKATNQANQTNLFWFMCYLKVVVYP